MSLITLIIGPQCSGKTTIANSIMGTDNLFSPNVSADKMDASEFEKLIRSNTVVLDNMYFDMTCSFFRKLKEFFMDRHGNLIIQEKLFSAGIKKLPELIIVCQNLQGSDLKSIYYWINQFKEVYDLRVIKISSIAFKEREFLC